jgi:hypothetical protein
MNLKHAFIFYLATLIIADTCAQATSSCHTTPTRRSLHFSPGSPQRKTGLTPAAHGLAMASPASAKASPGSGSKRRRPSVCEPTEPLPLSGAGGSTNSYAGEAIMSPPRISRSGRTPSKTVYLTPGHSQYMTTRVHPSNAAHIARPNRVAIEFGDQEMLLSGAIKLDINDRITFHAPAILPTKIGSGAKAFDSGKKLKAAKRYINHTFDLDKIYRTIISGQTWAAKKITTAADGSEHESYILKIYAPIEKIFVGDVAKHPIITDSGPYHCLAFGYPESALGDVPPVHGTPITHLFHAMDEFFNHRVVERDALIPVSVSASINDDGYLQFTDIEELDITDLELGGWI